MDEIDLRKESGSEAADGLFNRNSIGGIVETRGGALDICGW
jgi:hypothetical protein